MINFTIKEAKALTSKDPGKDEERVKNLVQVCTSLSVSLILYNLQDQACYFLQRAVHFDNKLPSWEGRTRLYISLAVYSYKTSDLERSEKYAFHAQQLCMEWKDSKDSKGTDLFILTNVIIFMIKWKQTAFKEARTSLDTACELLSNITRRNAVTKYTGRQLNNIIALARLSYAGLIVAIDNSKDRALKICKDIVNKIDNGLVVCQVVNDFMHLLTLRRLSFIDNPGYLVCSEFEKCMFSSLLSPFYDNFTLAQKDLVKYQARPQRNNLKVGEGNEVTNKRNHSELQSDAEELSIRVWWDTPRFFNREQAKTVCLRNFREGRSNGAQRRRSIGPLKGRNPV